jgi:transcriptional regulator with XRE-family HTH domain
MKNMINEFGSVRLFAEAVGVTPGAVYHWINGIRVPSLNTISKIVDLSGGRLSTNDFLPPPRY